MRIRSPWLLPRIPLLLLCPFLFWAVPGPAQEGGEAPPPGDTAEPVNPDDPAPEATDKPSRQLLAQAVKVLGGEAAMRRISTVQASGTLQLGPNDVPFVFYRIAPDSYRIETEHEMRYRQTGKLIKATDGEVAWMLDEREEDPEARKLPGKEQKAFIRSHRLFGPLLDPGARGIKFSYEGKGDVRGRPVYMLKVYYPDGAREWMYFDQKNGLPLLHAREKKFANEVRLVDHLFLNYKKFYGVYLPVKIEHQIAGGKIGGMTIESMSVNERIDPQLFAMPASSKKEIWLRQDDL